MSDPSQEDVTRHTSAARTRTYRKRRDRGIWRRTVSIDDAQLAMLEERFYLDPSKRGDPTDEAVAIEAFLADYL